MTALSAEDAQVIQQMRQTIETQQQRIEGIQTMVQELAVNLAQQQSASQALVESLRAKFEEQTAVYVQMQITQAELQASVSTALPSSQASPASTEPLPQTGSVGVSVQAPRARRVIIR